MEIWRDYIKEGKHKCMQNRRKMNKKRKEKGRVNEKGREWDRSDSI